MARHFGTVVVDERPFPITDIYLAFGQFHVVFVVRGPSPPIEGREWTVHDPDGGLVYRSIGGRARLDIPEQCCVAQ